MVFAVNVPPINDCTIQMGTYFQGGNDNSVSSKLRLTSAKHPCHSPWLTVDESSARHVMLDRFIQNCGVSCNMASQYVSTEILCLKWGEFQFLELDSKSINLQGIY